MDELSRSLMREVIVEHGFGNGTVIDMGSFDINGTYRDLISGTYIGADIVNGKNVDVIVGSNAWKNMKEADAVISGQTVEHVADLPAFMKQIYDILKPEGYVCIIAPSEGPAHNYPIWVGNFSEERMRQTVTDGGFEIISCIINPEPIWKFCVCVAKKPKEKKKYEPETKPVRRKVESINEDQQS